ncbi:MAG: restriction endonuclease [Anaerolineae bacterium]|nr:restriction endonuclease [Anaerolineae bacterium]
MTLSMIDAAYTVLKELGTPAHYTEIIREAISQGLVSTTGLTPGASLVSAISRENATRTSRGELPRFEVLGSGNYGLVEWRPVGIEERIREINRATREALYERLVTMLPKAFEELIGELLIEIGFDEETVKVTGRSGDGGIDVVGIMNIEGVTRLDVAVQVKRVKSNIPADRITALRGSLMPNQRGIFITTSKFTKQARQEATTIGKTPVSLVDCEQLLDLLFKHEIGVSSKQHTLYDLDEAYWPEAPSLVVSESSTPTDKKQTLTAITYPLSIFANYNGQMIAASLQETGEVIIGEQTYNSVSGAGQAVTGWKSCNGWRFWRFINPADGEECLLNVLRNPPSKEQKSEAQ